MSRVMNLKSRYDKSKKKPLIANLAERLENMKKNAYPHNLPLRDHDLAFFQLCERIYERLIVDQEESDEKFFDALEANEGNQTTIQALCQHKILESTCAQEGIPELDKNAQHYDDLAAFMRALAEDERDRTQRIIDFCLSKLEPEK